ncbi:GNAT family N-acetyltransferase [Mycobacterium parmense]|uniref:N-acetyltransferase n=1 Tax=Mycobacterium parmense TaxID=185642 RepID=A0A7I7YXP3_9MYCO|nr:GNAT family N-acetyltransferase [Mycobacterium parmense]MCV7350474.1 GNAT family N-acetyltransferase [Mycobacterium parmense]ORW48206.1 GNAT family acetyltransferase [Mycobacterium parmense]BBZ46102.1 N-acetyltransferase [Mycobacterium parmense]
MPGPLHFVSATHDDPLAQPLLAELAVEYAQRYGGTPDIHLQWLPVPATALAAPDGGMLVGVLDGVPVVGGAFQRYDAQTAELKRIWTDSAHRRRGYAKALLAALEAEAAARGYRRLYLITGNRQPEAEALYDATGYTRVPPDPLPSWGPFRPIAFEKWLTPAAR